MPQSAHATNDAPRRRIETNVGTFDVAAADTIRLSRRPAWIRALPPVRRDFVRRHCATELPARHRGTVRVVSRGGSPRRHARVSLLLGDSDRLKLGATDDAAPLLWLALVTVDAGQGPSVNLRAPVVINPARMVGCQVMPHDSLYPLRHPLAAE